MITQNVVCVVVTYGRRSALCVEAAESALHNGARRVLVVDNGSAQEDARALRDYAESRGERIHLLVNSKNAGSAPAFSRGIASALESGAEFVWLLDDDNVAQVGCLKHLMIEWSRLADSGHRSGLIAVGPLRGFRDGDPNADAELVSRSKAHYSPLERSFVDFDWATFVAKALNRRSRPDPQRLARIRVQGTFDLKYAPWGGLLLHKSVFATVGMPLSEYVVYCDDTEFTARIVSAGGVLSVTPRALVHDISEKWNAPGFRAASYMTSRHPALLYYSVRNQVHTERLRRGRLMTPAFILNGAGFLMLATVFAARSRRADNFRLMMLAVRDGLAVPLSSRHEIPLA
ncbi:glycosyltransferase [Dermacoccus profundi]|uniref:Glycosyltransferase n=1 Tax=Dermacoccus profundi TaxID=322602 RepID=A0ABN2DEE0_9MICO